MKVRNWMIATVIAACASCSDEVKDLSFGDKQCFGATLQIAVSGETITKSRVQGVSLPDAAEIGVFLRASDGAIYDAFFPTSVKYTAEGTGAGQVWHQDLNRPLRLSETVGSAYAYYPYRTDVGNSLKVPIKNDGTDWMYALPVTNLSASNNLAQFEMKHAMSLIRCKVVRGSYTGTGLETTVRIASNTLASKANMDLSLATVTDYEGIGEDIVAYNMGTLGNEPLVAELWAIPTGSSGVVSIWVEVDGNQFISTTPELTPVAGNVYNYTITINEPTNVAGENGSN